MKKGVIVVCIAITILAAIGIVMVLVMGLNGYGWFGNSGGFRFNNGWFGNRGNFNFNVRSSGNGSQVVLKEQELSFKDVEALYADCASYDIIVGTTAGDTAAIRQYGDSNTPSNEYFTLTQSGNQVNIYIDEWTNGNFNIGIGFYVGKELHLLIPQDWIGELSLRSVSGDIDMESTFALTTVSLASTSGDIYLQELSADTLKVDTVSGNITTRYPLLLQDSVSIKSISGDFMLNDITTDIYNFSSASGDIDCRFMEGSGDITTISGNCDITELSLTGDTSINTASGDVSVGIDRNASLRVEANSASGELSSYLGGVRDNFVGSSISTTYGDNPVGTLTFQSMSGDFAVVSAVINARSAA